MPACGDNVDRGCSEQISGRCKLKGIKCVGCERIYRHIRKVKKRGSKIIDKNSDREDETTPNIAIHSNMIMKLYVRDLLCKKLRICIILSWWLDRWQVLAGSMEYRYDKRMVLRIY